MCVCGYNYAQLSTYNAHWFACTCTCSFAVRFQKELQQWRVAPGVLSYVFCAVLGSPEGATARLMFIGECLVNPVTPNVWWLIYPPLSTDFSRNWGWIKRESHGSRRSESHGIGSANDDQLPPKTLSKHTPTLWIYQLAVESPHCQYVNHGKSSTRNKWAIVHIAI